MLSWKSAGRNIPEHYRWDFYWLSRALPRWLTIFKWYRMHVFMLRRWIILRRGASRLCMHAVDRLCWLSWCFFFACAARVCICTQRVYIYFWFLLGMRETPGKTSRVKRKWYGKGFLWLGGPRKERERWCPTTYVWSAALHPRGAPPLVGANVCSQNTCWGILLQISWSGCIFKHHSVGIRALGTSDLLHWTSEHHSQRDLFRRKCSERRPGVRHWNHWKSVLTLIEKSYKKVWVRFFLDICFFMSDNFFFSGKL